MIQDLSYNLCESLVENIDGVAGGGKKTPPTPITYLTQWKIVGNSEVHTLPYPDGVVLPNGYKRCSYLASDGNAYIELPYGFEVTDNVYIKCAMSELVDWGGIIASKTWDTSSNKRFTFGGAVTKNSLRVFTSSFGTVGPANGVLSPQVIADTNIHEWTYANYEITMDNYASKTYQEFGSGGSTDNLRIFYGYDRPRKYRIYDYRHTKGNTEYHLIPCLDSNDTPCMYDVINNQAYYNSAGSGSFTYKLYPQPTEIWSCGEYNATDGKYHILVQPLGGSIADIALTEPLRKVNDVADIIEFPSGTEGKALVTRSLKSVDMGTIEWFMYNSSRTQSDGIYCIYGSLTDGKQVSQNDNSRGQNILTPRYTSTSFNNTYTISPSNNKSISYGWSSAYHKTIRIQDSDYNQSDSAAAFKIAVQGVELIYELATPTTELVDAPQIEEADSYSMVISQGGKAVEWSSFETE